jgi:hypothetical protein
MTAPAIRHAGLIALRLDGYWRGALIEGASGEGKSDLAIRAIAAGWRLVADDRTVVFVSNGRLYGRAPRPLAGLIELRGIGVVTLAAAPFAEIVMLARGRPSGSAERFPEPDHQAVLGVILPAIDICPTEASAPIKLARAIEHLGQRPQQGYQAQPRLCRGG